MPTQAGACGRRNLWYSSMRRLWREEENFRSALFYIYFMYEKRYNYLNDINLK
jgi:hypothetical protein